MQLTPEQKTIGRDNYYEAVGAQNKHRLETTRRDFLELVAWSTVGVGAVTLVWPLVDSMNPSADPAPRRLPCAH